MRADIGIALDGDADRLVGLRQLRQRDQRSVRPQNAAFFRRNLGDCVSQVLLMVERDVREDADQRFDNVRSVQPPAQSHFQDHDVG